MRETVEISPKCTQASPWNPYIKKEKKKEVYLDMTLEHNNKYVFCLEYYLTQSIYRTIFNYE